jgi:hypothetical protein
MNIVDLRLGKILGDARVEQARNHGRRKRRQTRDSEARIHRVNEASVREECAIDDPRAA